MTRYPIPPLLQRMPPRRHYAIEASAGTGKTYLLEHRVVDFIVRDVATIDEILVVTFTEKATAEIRVRIRALLERILQHREPCPPDDPHWDIDQATRSRIEEALDRYDRAAITTIHGFCHRLIGDNAFSGGRHLRQEQIADITIFDRVYRDQMRRHFANDDDDLEYLRTWLDAGRAPAALHKLLYSCLREPGELTPIVDDEHLRACASATLEAIDVVLCGDPKAVMRAAKVHPSTARAAVLRLEVLRGALCSEGESPVRRCAAIEAADLPAVVAQVAKCSCFPDLERCLEDLAQACPPLEAVIAQRFVPRLRDSIDAEKHEHGLFDFDDMLSQLWRSLSSERGSTIARSIRERYRFALIDEFQDTDETQWNIFKQLYLDDDSDCYLTIIGDPKQAIYGFRGADVHSYLRAKQEVERHENGELVVLSDNYRSTSLLVAAYNDLFSDVDGSPFFGADIEYRPVVAASNAAAYNECGEEIRPFAVIPIKDEQALRSDELKKRLLDAIASDIHRVTSGESPVLLASGSSKRPATAGDCFVLTRSAAEASDVAEKLRKAGIPAALYQQEGLLTSAECTEILLLLKAVARPRNRSRCLRAWCTRFFDVELEALPSLRDAEADHPLMMQIYEWKELADYLAFETLFASILDDSGVIERELMSSPSERALTNFLHIFEILLEDVTHSRCDLDELIARLESWIRDAEVVPAHDRNLQRLETDRASVQIMTVHKSKGLEAGIVYLYGGFVAPPPSTLNTFHDESGRRFANVGKARSSAKERIADENDAEARRLLYVAVTRATSRVVLPYVDDDTFPRLTGYYRELNRRVGSRLEAGASAFETIDLESMELAPAPTTAVARNESEEPETEAKIVRPNQRGVLMTSYSRIKESKTETDEALPAPSALPALPPHWLPPGATTGLLVHYLFEHVNLDELRRAESLEEWRELRSTADLLAQAFSVFGLERTYTDDAAKLVWAGMRTPLVDRDIDLPALTSLSVLEREVEFLYPIAVPGRSYARGFMDAVFEWDGRYYVLDWKTDVLADYSAETVRDHVEDHYRIQADLYGVALARIIANDSIRFGGLLYVFVRAFAHRISDNTGLYFERPSLEQLDDRFRKLMGELQSSGGKGARR